MYGILIFAGALASSAAFMDSFKFFQNSNCTEAQFTCSNGKCIPNSAHCDGTQDCTDGSDELDCEMVHCKSPDYFRCKNHRCLSTAFVCDGEDDCDDFSDEENCEEFKKLLARNSTCPSGQWQCTDKLCIPQEWVCNEESDCLDGSDETLGCSAKIECDGFKCKNGHCIIKEWRCDGQNDCRDNSDEMDCQAQIDPKDCTWDSRQFLCADGKTCIQLSEVCDEKYQCPDKSDENVLCKSPNTCATHNCSHECVQLPTGPKCICPQGYHNIDEKHCEDINECETYGICDHKCKNVPGSYQCFCDFGYSLHDDKKTCKANMGEATMFFSSKNEIRAYLLQSEIYFPVAKNLKQVVGVDFDGHYVYWTDIFSEHESIVRSLRDGTQRELVITSGLGTPEDLHIDHITSNIYFTDAERQHIGVCTQDGVHCTILVNKDIRKPRGIVLYPEQGEMYWSDWGTNAEIARSMMDGSKDTSFVSTDIHWPNGLTIDYPNDRLYWTDAKLMTLESIKLDGTDRRIVLEGVVKHPYAIAVFENRLFWSDWATHSIQSCDKFTGKNHHTVIKESKEYIYGISIYHPSLHSNVDFNPCASAFCSDLCLLSGTTTYTCACPQDKELNLDGHTCKPVGKKQKLIIGAGNLLVHVEHQLLGKHDISTIPMKVKEIGALAYNSLENELFVSDLVTKKIMIMDLHSGFSRNLELDDLGLVTAMDFDYLGNNLYWCDTERNTVEVLNLNTMSRKILLHDMHGEIPESIALVPAEGVMFIAVKKENARETHIDRLLMDGTNRNHAIENGLLGPISLVYDYELHRVFMADSGTGNIESTSVEGDDRHGFRSLESAPIGLTSLKADMFWVNENSRRLYWADKLNSENAFNKKITLDLPEDVERMHLLSVTPKRIGLSPCQHNNGDCSHLCLHVHQSAVCACPVGMSLEKNHTCVERVGCETNEFFCSKSNSCILKKFRCDGAKNCPHGEDESDCQAPHHCPLDSFQCDDGECIKEMYRCDQQYDCRDKSDEHNCSHVEKQSCPPNQFKCMDGQCLNERFVCDGITDCIGGEDEQNCLTTTCTSNEFRCQSGACIPKNWECDHDYDCNDYSDEHAQCVTCSAHMFACTNGKCIDRVFICDHENDCGDNSDEMSCEKHLQECHSSQFQCTSNPSICLESTALCNGTSECPHHEDEQDCSDCHVEEFTCKNKKCIPTEWLCDRSDDCGDASDEDISLCASNSSVEAATGLASAPCNNGFQCKKGPCIDFSLVCNGEPNCYDGSDEDGVCKTACNPMNNPCSQICQKTPGGPVCKCKPGYKLLGDGHTCEDINECEAQPPLCSQLCHNQEGSFVCDCFFGFLLKADKSACKSDGTAMSMVFVSDNQIREMSQMQNSLRLIYSEEMPKITGLDLDVDADSIYFTIANSGTIHRVNKKTQVREYIEKIGQPQKIALDWITKNIYMVNNELSSKSITLCNFDDKTCARLLPIDIHRQVSAIAVDSVNKVMFYSLVSWWMFNSPSYVVYKTNLDGTGSHELIKSSTGYVTGLAFDLNKKELFYVDQHSGQIGKTDYLGQNQMVLAYNLTRPVGLRFFENQLYYLTTGGFMGKCKLYSPMGCDTIRLNSNSIELFGLAQKSIQPQGENPCKNHTCSHLCVPSKLQYKCLCENGILVAPNEKCDLTKVNPTNGDVKTPIYRKETGGHTSAGLIIGGIMVAICLMSFGFAIFYLLKKRNSGVFNISMRFQNPGYGLNMDDGTKPILTPGQHEYNNPVSFFEDNQTTNGKNKGENVMVDV